MNSCSFGCEVMNVFHVLGLGIGGDFEVSESGSVYSRRNTANKRKGKEKETAALSSCPPVVKNKSVR
jgi:hypothetical protein